MKKIVSILVSGLLILSLAACDGNNQIKQPDIKIVKGGGSVYHIYTHNGFKMGNTEIEETENGGYVIHIYVQPESSWKVN